VLFRPVFLAAGLALVGSAQGCLRIWGTAKSEAFSADVVIHANDNGLEVCEFNGGGQGFATCLLNYHLHFDWADNALGGPIPMTYNNPVNGY
ncbi:hypothetical protein FB451DRAFT_940353, partial [Mycena latifolia]